MGVMGDGSSRVRVPGEDSTRGWLLRGHGIVVAAYVLHCQKEAPSNTRLLVECCTKDRADSNADNLRARLCANLAESGELLGWLTEAV